MAINDAHVQRPKNAPTCLPSEAYELHQRKLVQERIFPSLAVEFEKLCAPAKFLCLECFAAMVKFEITSAFLGELEDSILAHLF